MFEGQLKAQAAAYATDSEPVRDASELHQQANRLGDALANLNRQIKQLRERLQPVTRPMPPRAVTQAGNANKAEQPLSQMGEGLRQTSVQVEQMAYEVLELHDSLAV